MYDENEMRPFFNPQPEKPKPPVRLLWSLGVAVLLLLVYLVL